MRGQLSLEFLLVVLTAIVMLSFLVPQMEKVKSVSDYALSSRNAQLILDKLYYSCERAQLQGQEKVTINALSNFSLESKDGTLTITFGNRSLSRQRFGCAVDKNISQGKTEIVLSPGP
jgi:hypothetical protein